jgi:trans-feruloyl-CoA hydratase/vanillin synthase
MLQIQDALPGVRVIGLDRVSKRNAIGVELTLAMEQVLLDTRYRNDVHAIVLHGIGGHFCAGMDLRDFFDSSTRSSDLLRKAKAATEHWRCHLLQTMPQRIFTAVEGYCLGAAMPMIQCADEVVAHANAQFGLPEINFGFVPGGQIVKSVGKKASHRALYYMALSGRLIDAHRAKQWGLVNEVIAASPLERCLQLAQEWAQLKAPENQR